jgi:hypothetical protein
MGSNKRKHSPNIHPIGILYCLANPYWISPAGSWSCYSYCHSNMASNNTTTKRGLIVYNYPMKKISAIALACLLMLSLTGCDSLNRYRYPCQDPKNWEAAECTPPECEASQTCTKDVIKITPITPEQEITNG